MVRSANIPRDERATSKETCARVGEKGDSRHNYWQMNAGADRLTNKKKNV
jgi:hypothetical protein